MTIVAPLALISMLMAVPAWSWGPAGHRVIAIIAEQRLSPPVREKVRQLLMDSGYSLADISNCADQLRSTSRQTPEDETCRLLAGAVPYNNGTWHYIQIPVPTKSKTLEAFCPQGDCVTAKITSFTETLHTSKDAAEQRQALLFLVHLVGDIHQPLHVVNRGCDMGGNSERVNFFVNGKKRVDVSPHSIWDSGEMELLMANSDVSDENAVAEALNATASPLEAETWSGATIEQIAWESYGIAVASVYSVVPYQNFCAGHESPRIQTDLPRSYGEDGLKVVKRQLIKAGVRLAALLETALGDL